jgi:hypothetical protein
MKYYEANEILELAIRTHQYDCVCEEESPHDVNDLWELLVAISTNFRIESADNFKTDIKNWLKANIKKCTDF